jgi:hypothetical protein
MYVDDNEQVLQGWKFGPFPPGMNQLFELPQEFELDQAWFEKAGMTWVPSLDPAAIVSPATTTFPMHEVVHNHESNEPIVSPESSSMPTSPSSPTPLLSPSPKTTSLPQAQRPYHMIISLEAITNTDKQDTMIMFQPRSISPQYMKQILILNEVSYLLQEIYGFTEMEQSQKECVVCMAEAKDTIVLPCRHLSLCFECAKVLNQNRNSRPKCPICRQGN